MAGTLVIVESPAKAKTITKVLGRGYAVRASMGHVRDLPKSKFGVDIEAGFRPEYIAIRGKGPTIKELKDAAKGAKRIFLATDPDREGEAIAWHLGELLGLNTSADCRIEFHEITARAITAAVKNPRPINMELVDAQQTRRILDRIVGYELSPLLWQKVRRGLSAGRVQSVAVRLICDREREIQAFKPEEYWTIAALLAAPGGGAPFLAKLVQVAGKKATIPNGRVAGEIAGRVKGQPFTVAEVRRKERSRHPAPPFTTSSLQQEASRKLGFAARKTMQVAQQLYEGLEVPGEGAIGLVTYIRTDSVHVAEEARAEARQFVQGAYGDSYVPPKAPVYRSRAGAQGAHEAIRPTLVSRTPEKLKGVLSRDQFRLYELIWKRFVASQMASAVLDTVSADITAADCLFRATGSTVKFPGFMRVYTEDRDAAPKAVAPGAAEEEEEAEGQLPALEAGQKLNLEDLQSEQHFTEPPPRYSEAMLVKTMEELGIGRPSTYAPTIETIQDREYVRLEDKRFVPTDLGFVVVDLLKEYFQEIIDVDFTADLEKRLDQVEEGEVEGTEVLKDFYPKFHAELEEARQALGRIKLPEEETDEVCEQCGRKMVIKHGRFGRFLACPGYPECKNTRPLLKDIGVACPNCGKPIVERRSRKGKTFFGCSGYPACTFVSWYEPVNQKCPHCGQLMVKRRRGKNVWIACANAQCPGRKKDGHGGAEEPAGEIKEEGTGNGAKPAGRGRGRTRRQ